MANWLTKTKELEEQFEKRKKEIENEINFLARDREIRIKEVSVSIDKHVSEQMVKGDKQLMEYECEWHGARENKNIELARLDSRIEERKRWLETNPLKALLDQKDGEITRLHEQVLELTKTIGEIKFDVHNTNQQ